MRRLSHLLMPSQRERFVRPLGAIFLLIAGYYLVWRAGWSLNLDALWLSVPLLLAEALMLVDFALFLLVVWRIEPPRRQPPPEAASVDVFITTYNEALDVLRSTVLAAVNISYPHETYVLDDGSRPEVARLAEELGAGYISREEHRHAKAGNVNNALAQTSGEFVAVFDADMVPHAHFLDHLLGYFADPKVALVQAPQEFYNQDSFQHGGDTSMAAVPWNEQALFYHVIQPGKNGTNSAFWCGTNAVLRRAALESVGGVATATIAEDIHTTLKLHAAGWRSVYHDELLATGIAPADLEAFLTQRSRWAAGAMQVLRSRDNPLWLPGLTLGQRLSYWGSMATYFSSFQKLVFLITPIVVLLSGILPIRVGGWTFAAHFLPYFLIGRAAFYVAGRGYGRYFDMERYNFLKAFAFARASFAVALPRRLRFKVTPKGRQESKLGELLIASPHFVLIVSTVIALTWAAQRAFLTDPSASARTIFLVVGFWALYNLGLMGSAVQMVVARAHRRATYRFPSHVSIRVAGELAVKPKRGRRRTIRRIGQADEGVWAARTTLDINLHGLALAQQEPLEAGARLRILIELPDQAPLETVGQVMNSRRTVVDGEPIYRVGVLFVEMSQPDRDALSLFLFNRIAMPPPIEAPALREAA